MYQEVIDQIHIIMNTIGLENADPEELYAFISEISNLQEPTE
jgi:hypothetical protein